MKNRTLPLNKLMLKYYVNGKEIYFKKWTKHMILMMIVQILKLSLSEPAALPEKNYKKLKKRKK